MRGAPVLIGSGDIAAKYNVTRRTAYNWLAAFFKSHGPPKVVRIGNDYRTTESALATLLPDRVKPIADHRVRMLEETTKEHGLQIAAMAEQISQLQRDLREKSNEWFRTAEKNHTAKGSGGK